MDGVSRFAFRWKDPRTRMMIYGLERNRYPVLIEENITLSMLLNICNLAIWANLSELCLARATLTSTFLSLQPPIYFHTFYASSTLPLRV